MCKPAALCQEHGAGTGGWPTVKSFTAATPAGVIFPRNRPGMVCEELRAPGVLSGFIDSIVASARDAAMQQVTSAASAEL